MKKSVVIVALFVMLFKNSVVFSQSNSPMPQMGGDFRPSYESYRLDKFIEQGDASYSGDMSFSVPVLIVPGRHGHNFDIKLTYNSSVTQRQSASWVGLGWSLEPGCVERTVNGRTDEPTRITTDPNANLGGQDGDTYRGNLGGRFDSGYVYTFSPNNVGFDSTTYEDDADLYQMSIDGGGMEIMPCNYKITSGVIVSQSNFNTYTFIPVQYKPWSIAATV
ncbi:MAG: SpvB/TcaC N-terminal domain-containing protein, partial [Candidatus Kryptoniota bacterium]